MHHRSVRQVRSPVMLGACLFLAVMFLLATVYAVIQHDWLAVLPLGSALIVGFLAYDEYKTPVR